MVRGRLVIAALLVVGCSQANPDIGAQSDECTQDGDCGQGRACNLVSGRCALLAPSVVQLEVLPPLNEHGWVRQEFLNPSPGEDGQVLLQLGAGARLSGRIHASDKPLGQLPAQIIATRAALLDGQAPISFETTATEENDTSGKANYSLWVNPGHEYSVQVLPNPPVDRTVPCAGESCAGSFPTRVFRRVRISKSEDRNLALAGEDASVAVRGSVVDAAGQPFEFSVQVRAVADDGTQSTIGFTCSALQRQYCSCDSSACRGEFTVRVPSELKTYALRIDPIRTGISASNSDPQNVLIPSVECTGLSLGGSSDSAIAELRLPAFPRAATFQLRVLGLEEVDTPIASAQVTLATSGLEFTRVPDVFDACNATYQRSAITNAEGRAELALIPGGESNRLYQASIVAPPKSLYAVRVLQDYQIGPQGGTLAAFKIPRRSAITGVVLDHLDRPIPQASIEAQEIPPDGATPVGRPLEVSATRTDEDGAFILPISAGLYNFQIRPPAGSGLPPFSVNAKSIAGPTDGVEFASPKPALVLGQVFVPGGRAADRFTVQVYDLVPETAEAKRFRAVARDTAITDVSGRFRMLVPFR